MSSRKRKHSPTAEKSGTLSKRARILSDLWKSQEEAIESSSASAQLTPSGPVYRIKAIVGEKGNKYLVDWADDPITGEKFKPDWQPKGNVNTAAVKAWETKLALQNSADRSPSKKSRNRKRKARAASVPVISPKQTSDQGFGNRPPAEKDSIDSSAPRQLRRKPHLRRPRLETSGLPHSIILTSQDCSLDRDLHIAYPSCLSTQIQASSTTKRPGSGLGESSSPPKSTSPSAVSKDVVVPDSQSLPGSSSYHPTSSTIDSITYPTSPRLASPSRSPGLAVGLFCGTRDSIEGPSEIIIPANKDPSGNIRRSSFAPASTIANSTSSSSKVVPPSLPRMVPGSSEGRLLTSANAGSYTEESLIFQTQVPLASVSRGSRVSASSDDHWQGAQLFPRPTQPASQISSISSERDSRRSKSSRATVAESLVIPEDYPQDHPSQATTTQDSTLSPRDPNSQPRTPYPYRQGKVADFQNGSGSKENNTLKSGPTAEDFLPSSIDSPEPPQPPPDSEEDMSELPMDGDSSRQPRSGTPTSSLRERLSRIRANTDAALAAKKAARHQSRLEGNGQSPSQRQVGFDSPARSSAGSQSPAQQARPAPGPLSPTRPVVMQQDPPRQVQSPDVSYSRTSKSPSIIPERLPYQVQDEPSRLQAQPLEISLSRDVPLPVRGTPSVPHTPITPSKLAFHKEMSVADDTNTLDVLNLGTGEYIVPLTMSPRINEQYCATVNYYAKSVRSFAEDNQHSRDTLQTLNYLLDELSMVTTHMDLQGSGPASQEDVDVKTEAAYAESCSEKFVFLGHVLDIARNDGLHIAVVARPGALLDIIETYLKAKEVLYSRVEQGILPEPTLAHGTTRVKLMASKEETDTASIPTADLVIAFDETFVAIDPGIVSLRSRPNNVHRPSPVLRLVVWASVEHIDLCLPRDLDDAERLRRLVISMLQTQKRVGDLSPEEPTTRDCAIEAANFVRSLGTASEGPWSLPSTQPIYNIAFIEPDSSSKLANDTTSNKDNSEPKLRYWPNLVRPKLLPQPDATGKRPFDLEWGESAEIQTKKQKMAAEIYAGRIPEVPERTADNLENWLSEAHTRITALEQDLRTARDHVKELEDQSEVRQNAFEFLRQENGNAQIRCHEIEEAAKAWPKERESVKAQVAQLVASRKQLEEERKALVQGGLNAPNPGSRAYFEQIQARELLEKENAAQKKKIASLITDFEFTRQEYQRASNAAADANAEIEQISEELPALRAQKEVNLAKWHQVRAIDINESLRKEKENLKLTLKMRDDRLQKVEGELVELKRGRGGVQTRGSSVQPRSPRGGSRGASPAPGTSAAGLLGQGLRPGRMGQNF